MLSYENKILCRTEIECQEFFSNERLSEKLKTEIYVGGFMWKS